MRKYSGIPELLEQYMEENSADERWITVRELCDRFGLTRYEYNTISGFLRRLESGPFREFPFIVLKIERIERTSPSDPPKRRYLVKRRSVSASVPGARGQGSKTNGRDEAAVTLPGSLSDAFAPADAPAGSRSIPESFLSQSL